MSSRGFRTTYLAIAAVASLVFIGIAVGCGSSDDSSSDWAAGDVSKAEDVIGGELSSNGLTPTKEQVECIVTDLESHFSPSEVFSSDLASSDDKEYVESLTKECLGDVANGPLAGLAACEDDPNSSECIEEAAERGLERADDELNEALDEESSEVYEDPYEDEAETENEGLNELNEELQQEYEEEGYTP